MVIPFRVIGSPRLSIPDICHQIESTASAESGRGILRRGRACRRHEIAWLAGPEDPASACKPAASTGWLRLGCTAQTKAPPEGRGFRQQGPACEGVAPMAGPPPQNAEPQSWLHRLPPQRVQPPRGLCMEGGGWACRHEHPDQGRRLTSPIRADPTSPLHQRMGRRLVSTRGIRFACHPRNSRSTRLRDGPAFFTALFTLGDARRS
jgi:hypothetical protein